MHNVSYLCERFSDSAIAYQGYGRGIELGFLEKLNKMATAGREGFLKLAQLNPGRCKVINAAKNPEEIGVEMYRLVREVLAP